MILAGLIILLICVHLVFNQLQQPLSKDQNKEEKEMESRQILQKLEERLEELKEHLEDLHSLL